MKQDDFNNIEIAYNAINMICEKYPKQQDLNNRCKGCPIYEYVDTIRCPKHLFQSMLLNEKVEQ